VLLPLGARADSVIDNSRLELYLKGAELAVSPTLPPGVDKMKDVTLCRDSSLDISVNMAAEVNDICCELSSLRLSLQAQPTTELEKHHLRRASLEEQGGEERGEEEEHLRRSSFDEVHQATRVQLEEQLHRMKLKCAELKAVKDQLDVVVRQQQQKLSALISDQEAVSRVTLERDEALARQRTAESQLKVLAQEQDALLRKIEQNAVQIGLLKEEARGRGEAENEAGRLRRELGEERKRSKEEVFVLKAELDGERGALGLLRVEIGQLMEVNRDREKQLSVYMDGHAESERRGVREREESTRERNRLRGEVEGLQRELGMERGGREVAERGSEEKERDCRQLDMEVERLRKVVTQTTEGGGGGLEGEKERGGDMNKEEELERLREDVGRERKVRVGVEKSLETRNRDVDGLKKIIKSNQADAEKLTEQLHR